MVYGGGIDIAQELRGVGGVVRHDAVAVVRTVGIDVRDCLVHIVHDAHVQV